MRVLNHWAKQLLWSTSLVLLIGLVMLSGPCACLAHCMILESQDHAHHHHQPHGAIVLGSVHTDCGTDLYNTHHPAAEPPSALTFGVILPLLLLPLLRVAALRFGRSNSPSLSIVHPPPRTPPRPTISPA